MARIWLSRVSDTTTGKGSDVASGTEPPDRPVLPPCGTTGTRCVWHQVTTLATSSALSGCTTASAWPVHLPR